ncbi:hypothetical protein TNCV_920071 [Trichonephila clavipes]|nr:hypothetical protein TNCV_920071 [Trichonephila clavipes]
MPVNYEFCGVREANESSVSPCIVQCIVNNGVNICPQWHINYDEHGRHNTDKDKQHKAAGYMTTEKRVKRERRDFQRHRFLYSTVNTK